MRASQLRIYTMKPGTTEAFVTLFRDHLVAARAAYGFTVDGAWTSEDGTQFVWVASHDDAQSFAAADKAYYDSPERAALPTSPAEYIESMDLRMLTPVN